MSPYDQTVTRYATNVRTTIRQLQATGTTGMSRNNLRAMTSTAGLHFPNANVAHRSFDDALTSIGRVRGFDIY